MVPILTYEIMMEPDIEQLFRRISTMQDLPSPFCPLNYSCQFSFDSSGFNVIWFLFEMDKEIFKSHNDLNIFRWQISLFLCPPFQSQPIGHRNGTGVCLAAVATVGIFGGGFAMKNFNSCDIRGVFGGYPDETQASVVKIRHPLDYEDVLIHTF